MVTMKKLSITIVGTAIFTLFANPVKAITFSIGGTPVPEQGQFSSVPGVTTIDFESGAPTSGIVVYSAPGSGPAVVSGNLPYIYAPPPDDATKYLTVAPFGNELGNRPVTINFAQKLDYFGLHWGSFGEGNSMAFYKGDTLIQSFTDADIASMIGVGLGYDAYVNFFAQAGEFFDKVVMDSSGIAFESDNHAYKIANPKSVPDPSSTLGLLAFGTFGVSSLLKRKQQQEVLNSNCN